MVRLNPILYHYKTNTKQNKASSIQWLLSYYSSSLSSSLLYSSLSSPPLLTPPRTTPPRTILHCHHVQKVGQSPWQPPSTRPHKPHHTPPHSLSKSYGPLFRLRLGLCQCRCRLIGRAIASLFSRSLDSNFSNRPPNSGAEHIAYNYQDLVFCTVWSPVAQSPATLCALHLFSTRALEDFRHVREEEVALLAGVLEKARGMPVNVGKAVNSCATNALARATVGRRVFMEAEEGEAGEFKEMVVELMRLAGVFNVGDFVPWLRPLDVQGVVRKMKKLHKRYDEFFDGIIKEHRRVAGGDGGGGGGAAAGDLLSVMLGWEDEEGGGKLSDTDIKALLLNLFTAGTDTTASTVEWALAELI
ncbi:hypothetical protein J5N97_015903 [Dioscorea zingiberensis]|uniref:Uncharacterized protein n=1 Tax=Dioscorea zingiberensis TaxID=325984 RepID=A0A9D5HF45_9LILI|nr:hypothetical protein J5N97_015903 [Dioscorea zingiberensis]